ncbi:hypothetical protein ACLKMH_21550 [Psychromonas sp. KJ10-10]|uniref:hypothetical protein n=1 Tax=Psychromonas sp. KJ10-10 TaxID=3391823 RepID=UPI0039B4AB56
MRICITVILLFYSSLNYSQGTKIIVWDSLWNNQTTIMMDYLKRALQLTEAEYGDYELIKSIEMEQGRSLLEIAKLKNSKLDIAGYGATKEREEIAIPIRIPMLNGLMGYRICLIKEGHQGLFDGIKNKQQLIERNIIIGQHKDWPDTDILRANQLPVHTTYKKELLFQQLIRDRFNCFSRGTSEINAEYLAYQDQGIVIEDSLLIYYPLPLFFFVNKSRPLLAQRLQLGLERLIESGEFESIFNQNFASVINELRLTDRVIMDLNNPTLSEETIKATASSTVLFRSQYFRKDLGLIDMTGQ